MFVNSSVTMVTFCRVRALARVKAIRCGVVVLCSVKVSDFVYRSVVDLLNYKAFLIVFKLYRYCGDLKTALNEDFKTA